MRTRTRTSRNRFAATLVAAIACAGGVRGQDAPLTPLTPAAAQPTVGEAATNAASSSPTETAPADGYAAAAELFRKESWGDAAAEFERFLSGQPDDPRGEQARFFLGESLLRAGQNVESAAKQFRIVSQNGKDPATVAAAQFRLGEVLYLSGRHAEAAAALETFVDAQPAHAAVGRARYYLTESAYAAGDYERAEIAAAFYTACYPDDASASRVALLQAASLLQLGRPNEARTVLTPLEADAGEQRDPVLDALDGSLDIADADDATARGDLDEAEARFQRFLTEHDKHDLAPYAAFRMAELSVAVGKWDDAAARFAAVLGRENLSVEMRALAYLGQVQALAQDRNWDEVLAVTGTAQQQVGAWSRSYEFDYLRGRAHLAKAEMNEARTAFARVLSSKEAVATETAALAQYMTAETHFLQRRYDAALTDYAKAAEHKYPHWQAAAQLQAGKCCEQLQRPTDALAAYDVVLRDFADSPFAAEAQSRREACVRQASAPAAAQRK